MDTQGLRGNREAAAAAARHERRLEADGFRQMLAPVDVCAVECQVLPLLRIELTTVALGN